VNTVAVNLKDCSPFASYSATNLSLETEAKFEPAMTKAEALEKDGAFQLASAAYEEVLKLHPLSAEAHYRCAMCLLQLTNSSGAAKHFQSACDLDTLPFRTDSRENDIIRKTYADFAGPWLSFFDANAWMAQAHSGIPGKEAFYEHVHFNFDGNYRLALGWADEVARLLPPPLTNHAAANWASQDTCEKRLGLTDWNRAIVIEGMVRRMQQPPLSGQENNQHRVQDLDAKVNKLRTRMTPENAQQARELYLAAIKRAPDDYCLHENFASFLVSVGDIAGAANEWQRVHQMLPQDYLSAFRMGELLSQLGKLPEAEVELTRATQLRPYLHEPYVELGKLRIAQGRFDQALKELGLARQLRPADAETEYHSGRALALLNRREEAIEKFRLALKLNPNSWQAHDALGGYLGLAGNIGDARAEYEQVVRLQPRYARGHLNLGVALLKQGEAKKAAEEFQEALRLEPTNAVAAEYLQQANKAR